MSTGQAGAKNSNPNRPKMAYISSKDYQINLKICLKIDIFQIILNLVDNHIILSAVGNHSFIV